MGLKPIVPSDHSAVLKALENNAIALRCNTLQQLYNF